MVVKSRKTNDDIKSSEVESSKKNSEVEDKSTTKSIFVLTYKVKANQTIYDWYTYGYLEAKLKW